MTHSESAVTCAPFARLHLVHCFRPYLAFWKDTQRQAFGSCFCLHRSCIFLCHFFSPAHLSCFLPCVSLSLSLLRSPCINVALSISARPTAEQLQQAINVELASIAMAEQAREQLQALKHDRDVKTERQRQAETGMASYYHDQLQVCQNPVFRFQPFHPHCLKFHTHHMIMSTTQRVSFRINLVLSTLAVVGFTSLTLTVTINPSLSLSAALSARQEMLRLSEESKAAQTQLDRERAEHPLMVASSITKAVQESGGRFPCGDIS